jgi:predicted ATPase with chaperone activity
MNLVKLTDQALADLRQEVVNECGRRTRMVVEGLDPAQLILGNELAKRAVTIAAAGGHSLLLMGPKFSGKTMFRAVANALGLDEVFEFRSCPCGEYGDPLASCRCTVAQVAHHRRKMPAVDVSVEVFRPNERERRTLSPGTSLDDMRRQVASANPRELVEKKFPEDAEAILKFAIQEYGLDPVTESAIRGVARTVAGLGREVVVRGIHVSEAINVRPLRAYPRATDSNRSSKNVRQRAA